MIFNSHTAVKKSTLGENGMNCLSLILFCDDTVAFLNDFLGTLGKVEPHYPAEDF